MIKGRQALQEIQSALAQEKRRLQELDSRLSESNDEVLKLDSAAASLLQRLARLRLQFLHTGEIEGDQGGSDAAVLTLIGERNRAYGEAREAQAELDARAERVRQKVSEVSDTLQQLTERIGTAELAVQEELATDEGYQLQLDATRAAERVAEKAASKAAQSEAELAEKGAAYDGDPLFTYLWRRNYGTPAYRPGGGPLAPLYRWLDGKVARLIGYADARPNYARLKELPERLLEHATALKERADAAFEKLQQLEVAGREAGNVAALEDEVARAHSELQELKGQEGELEAQSQAALDRLGLFAKGEDPQYAKAVQLLRSALTGSSLAALQDEALATPSPEDDVIVAELRQIKDERDRKAHAAAELKEGATARRERIRELERLRNDFMRAGMDAPTTSFPDRKVVSGGLDQYLTGLLTAEALWRLLNQQRVTTRGAADPTFGSGGLGRGTIWGQPQKPPQGSSQTSGRKKQDVVGGTLGGILGNTPTKTSGSSRSSAPQPPPAPRSKGSSGPSKGFRTGGRVGGGKFKTGGKF